MSVCLSVCNTITFESHTQFIVGLRGYTEIARFKLVCEGHRFKVKITAAKRAKISIPAIT